MPFENSGFNNYLWIFLPLTASSIIGYGIAKKIKMTSMPQMVSIFNGLGGLSAVLLSFIELYKTSFFGGESSLAYQMTLVLSLFIGSIAFFSSLGTGSDISHLTHLSGMILGYIYLKSNMRKLQRDLSSHSSAGFIGMVLRKS